MSEFCSLSELEARLGVRSTHKAQRAEPALRVAPSMDTPEAIGHAVAQSLGSLVKSSVGPGDYER